MLPVLVVCSGSTAWVHKGDSKADINLDSHVSCRVFGAQVGHTLAGTYGTV